MADGTESGVLDRNAIVEARNKGTLLIEPFNEKNLSGSSYDVTLGEFYYEEQSLLDRTGAVESLNINADRRLIRTPFEAREEDITWGAARQASFYSFGERANFTQQIVIQPGAMIIAHTNEFIGDVGGTHTTMMKARSSIGRCRVQVCGCAGWGDPNYHNRWAMEITNLSTTTAVAIPVGARIAQIVFFTLKKGKTDNSTNALYSGKYQRNEEGRPMDYDSMVKTWSPDELLPRLSVDKDRFVHPEEYLRFD